MPKNTLFISFFTPQSPSVCPSPPAESCFLIVMLMTVMMVDCPRLPGGRFGRAVALARCPPITWLVALSVATQKCVCMCVCVCDAIQLYVCLKTVSNFLGMCIFVPLRVVFSLLPGSQLAYLQKCCRVFSRSNTSTAPLDSYAALLCCVIIMSGRER